MIKAMIFVSIALMLFFGLAIGFDMVCEKLEENQKKRFK